MSRRAALLGFLIALPLLLAACATESASTMPTRSASPAPAITPTHTPPPTFPSAPSLSPSPTPTPTPPLPTEPIPTTYTVQPGDTLLGLAMEYGVPMAAIQLENGMGESTLLRAGEEITIPQRIEWEETSPFWVVYVVKESETLAGIAKTYRLDVETLRTVNGLEEADRIQVGQELVLPLNAPAAAFLPTPTPVPTDTPTPPPTLTPAPTPEPTAAPPAPAVASPAPPPADIAAWPRETVRIINEVRAQHGLGPLAYNETLAQAAQAHANDCQQRGWCSHTGSDGSNIKTRIIRVGYEPTGWAECWAWNGTPQAAVDMWMDEVPPDDAHRRTLLSTWLTEIGMGVAEAPSWGYFFIADFGRP